VIALAVNATKTKASIGGKIVMRDACV